MPDYYFLRSRQLQFLEDLAACPGLPIPALALPNLLFSHALAAFLSELQTMAGAGGDDCPPKATLRLVRAMLLYPTAVPPLLAKCGLKAGDVGVAVGGASLSGLPAKHCDWAFVFTHPLFQSSVGDAAVRLSQRFSHFVEFS
jgi:hypothetical protein